MWEQSVGDPTLNGTIMSLEIQQDFCDSDEKKIYEAMAKRKRNTMGEYTTGQKKKEVQQVKNIKWFAAHSVRIKDKLAELRAEIQCEMREVFEETV